MPGTFQAQTSRTIIFRSPGGNYHAIFMSENGDLVAQYSGSMPSPAAYFPDFAKNPVRMMLTVTSSASLGTVTPDSVQYSVAGTTLTFNTSGVCTTPGMQSLFALDGGQLKIIGNIAGLAGGAGFNIQAKATMGDDYLVAVAPVSVSPYVAGSAAKVTIAPGDTNNFTLTTTVRSVKLRARLFKDGAWVAPSYVKWEQADASQSSGWRTLSETSDTLTVTESMVDTYAAFRCTAYEDSTKSKEIGSDTQDVLDAGDPFDVTTTMKVNKTGSGSGTATNLAELDSTMPDAAWLEYACTVVRRDGSALPSGASVSWQTGTLMAASGLKIVNVTPSGNTYRVLASSLKGNGSQFQLLLGASITI